MNIAILTAMLLCSVETNIRFDCNSLYVFDNEIQYFRLLCLSEMNASHAKLYLLLRLPVGRGGVFKFAPFLFFFGVKSRRSAHG